VPDMRFSLEDSAAVAAFLFREARLIDERKFEAWAELFTPDALYWVPLRPGQTDFLNEMSIIRDDRAMLDARVARLRHPEAHADSPPVRTVHMLANIEIVERAGEETRVAGALLMAEWRDQRQTIYTGRVEWNLVALGEGGYAIRYKRVELVNCDGFHQQITAPF
jgi:3-phenylpropionate/cinnamic acid dioxygenase small subunit